VAEVTEVRFFAAARAAVGVDTVRVTAATLGELLAAVTDSVTLADPESWTRLQDRCSYLVDGVSTRDRATSVVDAELVDVMPPFAGG
jgi:sulfur-carrier protein